MQFYLFDTQRKRDNKFPLATTDAYRGIVVVKCDVCGTQGVLEPQLTPLLPVGILVRDVGILEDIQQAGSIFLVSKRFRNAVRAHGLTGIEFHDPVVYELVNESPELCEILRKCKEDFKYSAIHVVGQGGSIADTSDVYLEKNCDECGWRSWTTPFGGVHVDQNRWDGSDFFFVKEFGGILLSQRCRAALESAGLSNFRGILASEIRPPNPIAVAKRKSSDSFLKRLFGSNTK